ncbi:hypothetical protein TNCV_1603721 [Trichonephila clavipes]|nr:hypothetical protein TNCV_1603721 [Trichonephila clavipes]
MVSKVMTTYSRCSKTSFSKRNSERKKKPSERDRRMLKPIITSKKRTTAAKGTAELCHQLDSPETENLRQNSISQATCNRCYSGVTLAKPG